MPSVEAFLSGVLKAEDIGDVGATKEVTIAGWSSRQFEGEPQAKVELSFEETGKTLILNKTNIQACTDLFGAELDEWPGKGIVLEVQKTQFGSKVVNGIRVVAQ